MNCSQNPSLIGHTLYIEKVDCQKTGIINSESKKWIIYLMVEYFHTIFTLFYSIYYTSVLTSKVREKKVLEGRRRGSRFKSLIQHREKTGHNGLRSLQFDVRRFSVSNRNRNPGSVVESDYEGGTSVIVYLYTYLLYLFTHVPRFSTEGSCLPKYRSWKSRHSNL